MINLSTPNKQLVEELKADYRKADYWLTKKLGGEKKQREEEHRLVRKCLREKIDFATSDPIEYKSPNGNRWYIYIKAQRFTETIAHPAVQAFCYYETLGSIGAFVPFFDNKEYAEVDGCGIFTSHFFLRMSERLGIGARSRDMVKKFIEYIRFFYVDFKGKGKHADEEFDVYLQGALGRGKCRATDGSIYEVNTFIPENMLFASQRKVYEELKKKADKYVDLSPCIMKRRLQEEGNLYGVLSDLENNYTIRGERPDYTDKCMWLAGFAINVAKYMMLPPIGMDIVTWIKSHKKDCRFISEFMARDGFDVDIDEAASMAFDCLTEVSRRAIDKGTLHKVVTKVVPYVTGIVISERDNRRRYIEEK